MKTSGRAPTQRQLMVGEQLRQVIAGILQKGKFHHEALLSAQSITVSEVRPSPDLKNATVYVISLGGLDMEKILPALNENAGYFQKEINRKVRMKSIPKLIFKKDSSFEQAQYIETLIKSANSSKNLENTKDFLEEEDRTPE